MRVPRTVMAVGGVVLAAAAIGFMDPKAVHAVTAALVQVTNTAANPVVTQSVGQQAAQSVHLVCGFTSTGECHDKITGEQYVVPSNESLVITAVDIFPVQVDVSPSCSAIHITGLSLQPPPLGVGIKLPQQNWVLTNSSVHYTYPSGMVIGTGSVLYGSTYYPGNPGQCYTPDYANDYVDLYGYLTPA